MKSLQIRLESCCGHTYIEIEKLKKFDFEGVKFSVRDSCDLGIVAVFEKEIVVAFGSDNYCDNEESMNASIGNIKVLVILTDSV